MSLPKRTLLLGGAAVVALVAVVAVMASDKSGDLVTATTATAREANTTTTRESTTTTQPVELPAAIAGEDAEWTLIFDEPFNGADLASAWTTCYWWQIDGGCTIASNDELEWYQPDGARVTDGVLRLEAVADPQLTSEGTTLPYRSGMASTGPADDEGSEAGLVFTYGYVEAVVHFPSGAGTWPAVWLLSADLTSTPEIDIVEYYGGETVVKNRVHQRVDGEKISEGFETAFEPSADGWYRVAALWTPERVEFYFDDVLTGVVDDVDLVPTTPMYLIVNLAIGGQAGSVDEQALPQHFDIDSVRVWQQVST